MLILLACKLLIWYDALLMLPLANICHRPLAKHFKRKTLYE